MVAIGPRIRRTCISAYGEQSKDQSSSCRSKSVSTYTSREITERTKVWHPQMCIHADSLWHDGRFSAASLLLGLASNSDDGVRRKIFPLSVISYRRCSPDGRPILLATPVVTGAGCGTRGRLLSYVFLTFLRSEPHRAWLPLPCPYRY